MKRFIRIPYILATFLVVGFLMIASAMFELSQSKEELFELLDKNAHAILDAAVQGGAFSIYSNQLLEQEMFERLYDNAVLLQLFDGYHPLDDEDLRFLVESNDLTQVIFLNADFKIFLSSVNSMYLNALMLPDIDQIREVLRDDSQNDNILIHTRNNKKLYSIILERKAGGALIVSLDADKLLNFRKKMGIGKLIAAITDNPNIIYLAVQDSSGILTAKNVDSLSRIADDSLVAAVMETGADFSRETLYHGEEIYEIVHPFYFDGYISGVYRMGLSLEPLQMINDRIFRRLVIISIILLFIGTIFFVLINIRQQYEFVNREFDSIQSHYRNVVDNIIDGILTIDHRGQVITANPAAEKILSLNQTEIKKMTVWDMGLSKNVVVQNKTVEVIYPVADSEKYLSFSVANMHGNKEQEKIILIHDLTEKRNLELQIRQKEKLSAMGELASGVAHEVRNPLNAISTIVQQFDLDFEPVENNEEYHSLARLVVSEVRRINNIVTQFVDFARPPKLVIEACDSKILFEEMVQITRGLIGDRQIKLDSDIANFGTVFWDCQQMKQALINLLKNAVEACEDGGRVGLKAISHDSNIIIEIADDGAGIPKDQIKKIFDLYSTTKGNGTGLGLSIVHKIISSHNGRINISSELGRGTQFEIVLPKEVTENA